MSESILRLKDIIQRSGLSKSTIYDYVSREVFPQPLRLGKRSIGWRESEFISWQQKLGRVEYQ